MGEGQPVGAVSKPGILGVRFRQTVSDRGEPGKKGSVVVRVGVRWDAEPVSDEEVDLVNKGESRQAADDQAEHDERQESPYRI